MGLLDSVLGAVAGAHNASTGGGGLGSVLGTLAQNPQILQAISGMLGNNGTQGGLAGLVQKFQQAGMGDVISSWVGSGANQPISGEQLSQVLGSDTLADLASRIGVDPHQAAGQLSSILPGLIDQLTPQGHAPAGGLGDAGDLMGMMAGLLRKAS